MDALKGVLAAPRLTPLRQVANPKGDIFHAMKRSDDGYAGFGEAYFTAILAGEAKGWKRHARMTLNLVVPRGAVEFFLHDGASQRHHFLLGEDAALYQRLTVPPGWWMAFRAHGGVPGLVLNLASIEHDPTEAENLPLESFALETAAPDCAP